MGGLSLASLLLGEGLGTGSELPGHSNATAIQSRFVCFFFSLLDALSKEDAVSGEGLVKVGHELLLRDRLWQGGDTGSLSKI